MTGKISEDDDVAITDTMKFASEDGGVNKAPLATRFKAYMKTYFDTLYLATSATAAAATKLATARNIDGQAFDGTASITVIAPGTHAATSKTTPVDADELSLVDSAASNVLKKLTWANLKATLKTYFDTLYCAIPVSGTFTPVLNGTTSAGAGTYTTQVGRYTKIGNCVFISATVAWSAHTGTGNMIINGLPFAPAVANQPITLTPSGLSFTGNMAARVEGTDAVRPVSYTSGGNIASQSIAASGTLMFSGYYFT